MKRLVAFLLLFVCAIAYAKPIQSRTVSVSFDTDTWNQNMLLKYLNDNGKSKGLTFRAVSAGEPFDYKIAYDNSIKPIQSFYGQLNTHAASVTCSDPSGQVLFTFTREARSTEKGAANAASEEIIKRLLALEKVAEAAKRFSILRNPAFPSWHSWDELRPE